MPGLIAAASATTGVDWVADFVGPVIDEVKLALIAGLALLVVVLAIRLALRILWQTGLTENKDGSFTDRSGKTWY